MTPSEWEALEKMRSEDKQVDPVELLSQNLQSYQLMLRLAEQARDEIISGNGHGLAQKLAKRQQLQVEISARDRIIEGVRKQLAHTPMDDKIAELVKSSAVTMTEIQKVDRTTLSLIQGRRNGLRQELTRMRQGKRALHGYGKRAQPEPRFLDRQG